MDVPASATLTIDTGATPPQITGAGTYSGILQSQAGGPDIAVFSFSKVTIAAGSTVLISGRRPLALLSQSDIDILAPIDLSGSRGGSSTGDGGSGMAGGSRGGSGGKSAGEQGMAGSGPGEGSGGTSCSMMGDFAGRGGGAGFGGMGYNPSGSGGRTYGALLARLEGGSGGGGAAAYLNPADMSIQSGGGGAGGGALELGAVGAIRISERLQANGGPGGYSLGCTGGSGSGGALLIHGKFVNYSSTLSARAGESYEGGGGGRIAILGLPSYVLGTLPSGVYVDGHENGTVVIGAQQIIANSGTYTLTTPIIATAGNSRIETLVQGNLIIRGTAAAVLAQDNVLPATALLQFESSASYNLPRFELGLFKQTVAGVAGRGEINLGNGELSVGEGNASSMWSGQLSGSGQLRKVGDGTLTLGDFTNNMHSGQIAVSAGTLRILGWRSSSAVLVTGGTLSGYGDLGPLNAQGGTIVPELGPQYQSGINTGSLSLEPGATLDLSAGSLRVSGSVKLSGTVKVPFYKEEAEQGKAVVLIANDGSDAVSGQFTQIDGSKSPLPVEIDYAGGDGNDVAVKYVRTLPQDMGSSNPPRQLLPSQRSGCSYSRSVSSPGSASAAGFLSPLALLFLAMLRRRRAPSEHT